MLEDGARADATLKKPRAEDDSRTPSDAWNANPREDQTAILATRRSLSDSKPKGNTKKKARHRHKKGFTITNLFCDSEGALTKLKDEINSGGILLETTPPNNHDSHIEVQIKVTKERVRSIENSLPTSCAATCS